MEETVDVYAYAIFKLHTMPSSDMWSYGGDYGSCEQ